MVIGICPTVDFAFKLLFGSLEHTRITIHFLNAILGSQVRIDRITIRNPMLDKQTEDDKLAILDVLAVDEHNRLLNIEIQTTIPAGMHQRLAYYASSMYSGQLTEGAGYPALRPAICICVVTKPMFSESPQLHLDFRLRESSGLLLTDDLQVHVLQLSNLSVTAQNVPTSSPIEQWAFFLLNADQLTMEEVRQLFSDVEFSEAAGVLEMISKNPEQRQQYDARLKFQRDEAGRLEAALNEGIEQGLEQGIEKGRVEGLKEGMEKGIQKGQLLGRIDTFRELLGINEPTREELSSYNEAQLTELVDSLKQQLRSRGT